MNGYVSLVKNWVQTGQEMLITYTEGRRKKAALVRIDKTATMQEAKCFNNSPLDPPKCIAILVRLIYLLNQGEPFTDDEGTQLFFAITKLLQSEEAALRRAVYVYVKEMRSHPSIYIVTSSLLKDIHHKNPHFRRNSLRAIPLIVDASSLTQIERYIKALIADADPSVASAAILAGLTMFKSNEELVKKWGSEVQEKLGSRDQYVQYHALMLLGDTKRRDPQAYRKILFGLTKQGLVGLAAVQYLRMMREATGELESGSAEAREFVAYLGREVRNKEDMVQMEACKLACESALMSNKELLEVVRILEGFLVGESTVKKYAVLKIFNSLLRNQFRKSLVVNVKEIEKVLNDTNTSLSSIAASILLRICSENYLDTLFARIDKTMTEMSADYKKDVLRALPNVLKTYPNKYALINRFLLALMRREDAPDIKSEAIAVMGFEVTELGGPAKTECIRELTRFLAATTYHRIHFQILGIVSREAGQEDVSSELFKNIISEVYLQEGAVRACSLSTLIKLADHDSAHRHALEATIQQFRTDSSLEVRDRLVFRQREKPFSAYELDIMEKYLLLNAPAIQASTDPALLSLEAVHKWGAENGGALLPGKPASRQTNEKAETSELQTYREIFAAHPTFKEYGELRKINRAQQLSDPESELFVTLRLFLFEGAFIAEFKVHNNLRGCQLEDVRVDLKHSAETFQVLHVTPAKLIPHGQTADCYVGIRKAEDCEDLIAEEKFTAMARYTVREGGESGKKGYQDEFSLEGFEIKLASYMTGWQFEGADFGAQWEKLKGFEENGTFQLKYASTQAAEQELLRHFGLQRIDVAAPAKGNMVAINLAGRFLGSKALLVVLMLAFDTKLGCLLKIKIKSEDEELTSDLLASLE